MAALGGLDLTGTVRSLLNIEVNTIVSDSVMADQMPALPHAVLDIAGWYADVLCKDGVDLEPFFNVDVATVPTLPITWTDVRSFSSDMLVFSSDTFERLRWAAKAANKDESARGKRLSANQRVMLDRIINNADTIKEMFKQFGPDIMSQFGGKSRAALVSHELDRKSYFVPPDELVALQKIWDLGVAEVVAQTIVFLSGNVTTRVQQQFHNPAAALLFSIHRQSVDVSVGCWHYLLQAIQEIAGTAVNTLLGRRP